MTRKPTLGFDAEWDDVPALKASRRSTTSSRTPGRRNEGTVYSVLVPLLTCPNCGGKRLPSSEPHAPRWVLRDGRHVQVDCSGTPCPTPTR